MNTVNIIGRITHTPDVKTTANGKSVLNFSIAVPKKFDYQQTDFYDCVAWDKTADLIADHFFKGSQIPIEGHLQTRQWEDREGNKRKSVEIVVDAITFLDKKESGTESAPIPDRAVNNSKAAGFEPDFTLLEDDDDMPF